MKIELKNIKHYSRMTEETNACSADVYLNGKKVGTLENSGKGEGYYPRLDDHDLLAQMEAWAKAQPAEKTSYGDLPMNLDFYFSTLVYKDLTMREAKKHFKNKVCVLGTNGELRTTKKLTPAQLENIHAGKQSIDLQPGQKILKTVEEVFEVLLRK